MVGCCKTLVPFLIATTFLLPGSSGELNSGSEPLQRMSHGTVDQELSEGEAIVWYLGHSGWAVKTQNHFLIFDYWEAGYPAPPGGGIEKPDDASLAKGYIEPSEIANENVYVFVSHAHSDHFDKAIFAWEKSITKITYIFGWKASENPEYVHMTDPRGHKNLGDLEIHTVSHQFDDIPEVAFLITVDGVVIYHAGDHACGSEGCMDQFIENLSYLSGLEKTVDIAFHPTFGGEYRMLEKLSPRVMFPMHGGGREHEYKKFAVQAGARGVKAQIVSAEKKGDEFTFGNGLITQVLRAD